MTGSAVRAAQLVLRVSSSRRARRAIAVASIALAVALAALAILHFARGSWPLAHASPGLVVASGFLLLLAAVLKALGWRRLFAASERPDSLALAAAGGGATVAGIALPGRFDEAVRVAIVRRYRTCPAGVRVLCLSLVVLGLIDAAALVPLASLGAVFSGHSAGLRTGLVLVAVAGVAAAVLIVALPRVVSARRIVRFRLGRWLGPRATPLRRASEAWAFVLASWVVRALALFLLLGAFGLGLDFPRAVIFLCAGAAAAVLPLGPAGAATQIGAGTAILTVSGIGTERALDFAVSAQALGILVGAAILATAVLRHVSLRQLALRRVRA